jgi:hypothetical protein
MDIDRTIINKKSELLAYFRGRASEAINESERKFGLSNWKKLADSVNKSANKTLSDYIRILLQIARKEDWTKKEILESVLLVTYTGYVAMIEARNKAWKYDYMTFSRRMGGLWEHFCKLCFEYALSDLNLYIPPLFLDIKKKLTVEVETYIDSLNISEEQKITLKFYYQKVWNLVVSGEIQLDLDFHFEFEGTKYSIDFKSGFGSNEKGNTNRLLLVATIYQSLEEGYNCVLLVRAEEDRNNHYFRTLRNSGVWKTYCGSEAYSKIADFTGFDIKQWLLFYVNWREDLASESLKHLVDNELDNYLW